MGPPRKIGKMCHFFFDFSGLRKKIAGRAPNGAGTPFSGIKKNSPTIWAERILILRTFDFGIFWGPKFASMFFMGEKTIQKFPPNLFMGEKYFQEFAPIFFMGEPHVGPPTWAQAWAQTPPPDEFSDPNLTPLPTHPGIKYVARTLAAIMPKM